LAITGQNDRRKGIRRQSNWRKGDIKIIRLEGDRRQEATVRHEAVPQRKKMSIWAGMKNLHIDGARLL
jgi:hypothetical protein